MNKSNDEQTNQPTKEKKIQHQQFQDKQHTVNCICKQTGRQTKMKQQQKKRDRMLTSKRNIVIAVSTIMNIFVDSIFVQFMNMRTCCKNICLSIALRNKQKKPKQPLI